MALGLSKTDVFFGCVSWFACASFMNIYTFHVGGAMRTNIVIDNSLMQRAMKATGLSTKKAVVEEGLRLLIKVKGQEGIRRLRGKIEWEGDLGAMREGRIKAVS
jgi:Arc/MetJ family transcription regulator